MGSFSECPLCGSALEGDVDRSGTVECPSCGFFAAWSAPLPDNVVGLVVLEGGE